MKRALAHKTKAKVPLVCFNARVLLSVRQQRFLVSIHLCGPYGLAVLVLCRFVLPTRQKREPGKFFVIFVVSPRSRDTRGIYVKLKKLPVLSAWPASFVCAQAGTAGAHVVGLRFV